MPMTLGQAAAEVIRAKLDERDWNDAVLARRAGMNKSTLWRKLSVATKFDLDAFDACAIALGMDPGALMREVVAYRAMSDLPPEAQEKVRKVAAERRPRRISQTGHSGAAGGEL